MDFSMLESAHERQFAMAQLGTRSVGFEAEHKTRIQYTFQTTKDYFTAHVLEEHCRPTSPHEQDLGDLRLPPPPFETLPSLEISDWDLSESELEGSQTPMPSNPPPKPTTSFLTLDQLMNPAPASPRLKESTKSPSLGTKIQPDDSPELQSQHFYHDPSAFHTTLGYARANRIPVSQRAPRTRRDVRMRRSRSELRVQGPKDGPDGNQVEDDVHLTSKDPIQSHYRKKGF